MIEFYNALKAMVPAGVKAHLFAPDLPDPPTLADYPYVLFWGSPGTEFSGESHEFEAMDDEPDATSVDVRVTYVATSSGSLQWLLGKVRPALNRQAPVVDGWRVEKIRLSSLTNITPDDDVSIGSLHPLFTVDEFTLTATRI